MEARDSHGNKRQKEREEAQEARKTAAEEVVSFNVEVKLAAVDEAAMYPSVPAVIRDWARQQGSEPWVYAQLLRLNTYTRWDDILVDSSLYSGMSRRLQPQGGGQR